MAGGPTTPPPPPQFGLAEEVLTALPKDPFEQLDVARKITSIALATRISSLESDADRLHRELADRDELVADLRARLETLDAALSDATHRLNLAADEKENLENENTALSSTIKKLTREVSKLEVFRKTLVQSLQEEDNPPLAGPSELIPQRAAKVTSFTTGSLVEGTVVSESGSLTSNDGGSEESFPRSLSLASGSSTPSLGLHSPPKLRSPTKLSNPTSPRQHSISFSTARNLFEEKSLVHSSFPSSHRSSTTSPFDTEPQSGRTRVDGKEFFRQVRNRLSYEQFSAFLANVKELNSHKQTKEETLCNADKIFGADNKDLYGIFEGLITRNLH